MVRHGPGLMCYAVCGGMVMEVEEILDVWTREGNWLGTASRQAVHRWGLWHHTFQIWFVEMRDGKPWIWFQRRSPEKAQYGNLWDITVAGHLLSGETSQDGFREIREELGIDLDPAQAFYFGVVADEIFESSGADRELCHVFFAWSPCDLKDLKWSRSEVADVGAASLEDAASLVTGLGDRMTITTGEAQYVINVGMLVPHSQTYYQRVFAGLRDYVG